MSARQSSTIGNAFAQCRGALWSAGFFSFFINILMLTGPLFMLQVYDRVLTSQSMPTLVALFLLTAMLFAFMGFLDFIRSRILVRSAIKLDETAKHDVFDAMIRHQLKKTPDVKSGPLWDLKTIRQFLSGPGPAAFFDMPWVPFYIAVNFMFHWVLGVFSMAAAVLLLILSLVNELANRNPVALAAAAGNRANGLAEEGRHNAEVLKAMGMLENFRARWSHIDAISRRFQTLSSDRGGLISAITKSLRMFLQSAVLAVGAALAISQEITPGTMIAASIILSRALAPLEQAIQQWRALLGARKAYRRLQLATQTDAIAPSDAPAQSQQTKMDLPAPAGLVEVSSVAVMPPASRRLVLQGVNFRLEPGDGLGVIGGSGAGKTALLRIIAGLWQPSSGTMRLDGAELSHYPDEQRGRIIGYLPQNVALFDGTVKENIARLAADPNPAAVVRAAQMANVHDLIQQLPDGYNTVIGSQGITLSAGQQQRIALARAFYGKPVLVVLDEPNAHLDAIGEAALVQAVKNLRAAGSTVVIAAHRPSAIAAVSKLLYLKDGRQLEFGPREAVLKRVTLQTAQAGGKASNPDGPVNGNVHAALRGQPA